MYCKVKDSTTSVLFLFIQKPYSLRNNGGLYHKKGKNSFTKLFTKHLLAKLTIKRPEQRQNHVDSVERKTSSQ